MANWNISGVYHGANLGSPFSMFEAGFSGKGYDVVGSGFYFTDCRETAMGYSRRPKDNEPVRTPYMYVCDLAFEKPYIRLNQDNCGPISIPIEFSRLKEIMRCAPNLDDRDRSPLINFGHSELLNKYGAAACHSRRVAAEKQAHLYWEDGEVNINSLENDWFRDHPELFRSLLRNATGYDSIIVHFADGENTFVAWFPYQIEIKEVHDDRQRVR